MNIKGHTEIQLRDAKTGRLVQHTHDDNMVTNGLAEFLKNHGMLNNTPFSSEVENDLIITLLGGILLFNDTLPESADGIWTPDGIKMTANATHGVVHTGNPTELGSFDDSESGWQNAAHTVFRLVFNWATSQGNGVIKSVALTSRAHGFVGEGNSQSGEKTTDRSYTSETYASSTDVGSRHYGLGEDVFAIKNNMAYSIKIDSTAQEFIILKHSVNDTVCDIRNKRHLPNMDFEEVATLSNPSTSLNLMNFNGISTRFLSDKVIMALSAYNGVIVLELSDDLDEVTDFWDITATATGLQWNNSNTFFLTDDGAYLILYSLNDQKLYKIEIDNPTNITQIEVNGTPDMAGGEYIAVGKRHYFRDHVYDETINKVYPNNDSSQLPVWPGDIYKDSHGLLIFMSGYNSGVGKTLRNNAYLATVNNLQNAVTKDSSQTMKVIYTLIFS